MPQVKKALYEILVSLCQKNNEWIEDHTRNWPLILVNMWFGYLIATCIN